MLFDRPAINLSPCNYLGYCRGGSDADAGGWDQVPVLLADAAGGPAGGGPAGALPRPRHPAHQADTQHSHHDGHLRAYRADAHKICQVAQP